ncbi:hypothetical protein PsYK624_136290 [Phanerochaete sordida]|uniref:Uncharacterized protein n=1 Tax=Phanerochaete sordida TaxID=48140 RepID=A0A9P3GLA9_9APHY|nr:hypothetical protein PsYK624_136290 [Phanerochaete sordida]
MGSFAVITLIGLVTASALVAGIIPLETPDFCSPGTMVVYNNTLINGKTFVHAACESITAPAIEARGGGPTLSKRLINLCGAPCTTDCISGTGGPDPNDCSDLANLYEPDGTFEFPQANWEMWWYLDSCKVFMGNYYSDRIEYCYDWSNWAGVVEYVAWNCQATTGGYNGGNCKFYDSDSTAWLHIEHS